jgi:hypothetical protein
MSTDAGHGNLSSTSWCRTKGAFLKHSSNSSVHSGRAGSFDWAHDRDSEHDPESRKLKILDIRLRGYDGGAAVR